MNPLKRLMVPAGILLVIALVGTLGYTLIEKWSMLDSFYMLVITLFTVGFGEVHPLSPAGRILTMAIIISGVSAALYLVGQFGEIIVEGQLFGYRRRKRMERKLKEMKEHYIICGYGRVGHQVAKDLEAENIPYVVVDIKEKTAEELEEKGVPYIIGDVTAENLLENSGVERAKGLIAANDSDVANVYVTLSARALNKDLFIVARASTKAAEEKLKTAGANKVISPYYIAGRRLAALATKPVASDFLDTVMHGEHLEFGLREISISDHSPLVGKTLAEAQIRQRSGATILAIRRADGGFDLQPLAPTKIEKGDILVAIGTQEQLELLAKMAE